MVNYKRYILVVFAFVLIGCMNKSGNEDMNVAASAGMESVASNNKDVADELIVAELPLELNEDQQKAYQLRAQQKFQDFLDYLKIVSDPNLDKGLVKHSEELMKELFISDTLNYYSLDSVIVPDSRVKNLTFITPLQKDSLYDYFTGKLQVNMFIGKMDTSFIVNTHLIETNKQFGDTEQKTVEVKLGNIY